MDKFRKTFSVRKKKDIETSESSKPQLWIEDERKIREGSCSFQVKYLGCIEVFESRGMQVCEEAIKALRKSKKKAQRAILYVSGDALRVSDEISKHLIVDQTIEKVSFCAPDRGHDKGFAYICRDGATRRWMCHAFLAVKESGERLSHAVGCAFAICLERKQKRERDAVQATYANEDGSFVRMSSFRQTTLSERLLDPQSAIIVDHNADTPSQSSETKTEGSNKAIVPFAVGPDGAVTLSKLGSGAIPRPRASPSLIERQTSLRLFPKLQETSPFKHNLSMRAAIDTDAPTTLLRTNLIMNGTATIPEETSTELEEVPTRTTNQSTILQMTGVSLTPQPSSFALRNPLVSGLPTASSTFPVSFDDTNIGTASSTAAMAAKSTSGVREDVINTSILALDPFSAAPVNPATIQQHQAAQKQHLQLGPKGFPPNNTSSLSPSRVSPPFNDLQVIVATAEASPTPKVASFHVTEWSEVARNGASNPGIGTNNGHGDGGINASCVAPSFSPIPAVSTGEIVLNSALDSSSSTTMMALFGAEVKSPILPSITTGNTSTPWPTATEGTTSEPWILDQMPPAESMNFAVDPFDIGWAERATAMAQGQLVALPSFPLPFTVPPKSPPSATIAGKSCTNPFLFPIPSDEQRLGASAGPGF